MPSISLNDLPNASALTGAEVVHGLQGPNSRKLTAQQIVELASGSLHLKFFGAVGNGIADDTAAFQSAVTAAVSTGKPLLGDTGAIYRLTSVVTASGGLDLQGNFTIRHPKNSSALIVAPAPGSAVTVSSIGANVQYPAFATQLSTPIVVSSATTFRRGQVCFLSSDDVYAYGNGVKRAELVRILEVVGTTVYTHGIIEDTYSTNTTLRPLSTASVVVDGPTFEVGEDAYAATVPYGYLGSLVVVGAVLPKVKVKVRNGTGAGVATVSCWSGKIEADVRDLRDRSASNALGYGVCATGATKYTSFDVTAERVRHAFTNGDFGGTDPLYQGIPRRETVTGVAINSTAAAWDTHVESSDTHFTDCEAYYGNGDADSTGNLKYAFQLRGKNNTVTNPRSRGSSGFYITQAATWGYPSVTTIFNPDVEVGASGTESIFATEAKTSADVCTIKFFGGRFKGGNPAIANNSPRIEMHGTLIEEGTTFRLGQNNDVTLWDVTRANEGNISEGIIVDAGTRLDIDNHKVRSRTGFIGGSKIIQTGTTAGTATVRLGRIYSDVSLSSNPIIVSQETTTLSLTTHQVYPRKVLKGTTAQRPTLFAADQGTLYMDTTLSTNGRPIWWNGVVWVDYTGASV